MDRSREEGPTLFSVRGGDGGEAAAVMNWRGKSPRAGAGVRLQQIVPQRPRESGSDAFHHNLGNASVGYGNVTCWLHGNAQREPKMGESVMFRVMLCG